MRQTGGRAIRLITNQVNLCLPGLDEMDDDVSYNPKCIRVVYCADPALTDESIFFPAKRSLVPMDANRLQVRPQL